MIKNSIDIETILYEDLSIPEDMFDLKDYNNSHYFLLPLYENAVPFKFKSNYVGSFVGDARRKLHIHNSLILVFRFNDFKSDKYQEVQNSFEHCPEFTMQYYAGFNNGNLVAFVLRGSDEIDDAYNAVVNSKYSEVHIKHYQKYQNAPFSKAIKKRIQGVLLKEEWHKKEIEKLMNVELDKDCELWTEFEPSREIFRFSNEIRQREVIDFV